MVYAPNLEYDGRLRPGAPVVLSWNPAHSFGLEATGNVKAGLDEDVLEVASAAAGS
jgi:spermidine/putrescine transport system ATP-binding protein